MRWLRMLALFALFAPTACQDDSVAHGSDAGDVGNDAGANPCADLQEHDRCTYEYIRDGDINYLEGSCELGSDCVLECVEVVDAECTVIGGPCGCDRICYYTDFGHRCTKEGAKAEGEVCENATDCVAPGQCLQVTETGDPRCYLACDDSKPCMAGECTDTGLGFSVCLQEVPRDGGVDGG